ncbi:hypothetical protein AB9P05_04665 [Roseivirga sp. BDSF3-8]|uniref:hypothetical protein n=1 Tax=Roseivirga sp. BDSF3-8 TaxID=3241598 RepID=UPI00353263DB
MHNFEKLDQKTFEKLDREEKNNVKGGSLTAVSIMTYDPTTPTQPGDTIATGSPSLVVEESVSGSSLDTSYVDDSSGGGGWV